MSTKINLAEKRKILDFKEAVSEKLSQLREERELMEKNEIFKQIIAEKFLLESEGSDYDDGSETLDEDDLDLDDSDYSDEDYDHGLSAEEEEEILKEFENELGA